MLKRWKPMHATFTFKLQVCKLATSKSLPVNFLFKNSLWPRRSVWPLGPKGFFLRFDVACPQWPPFFCTTLDRVPLKKNVCARVSRLVCLVFLVEKRHSSPFFRARVRECNACEPRMCCCFIILVGFLSRHCCTIAACWPWTNAMAINSRLKDYYGDARCGISANVFETIPTFKLLD